MKFAIMNLSYNRTIILHSYARGNVKFFIESYAVELGCARQTDLFVQSTEAMSMVKFSSYGFSGVFPFSLQRKATQMTKEKTETSASVYLIPVETAHLSNSG